jgi:hypothetical protein
MPVAPDAVRRAIVRFMMRRTFSKLRDNWIVWFARLLELAKRDAAIRDTARASAPAEDVIKAVVNSRMAAG